MGEALPSTTSHKMAGLLDFNNLKFNIQTSRGWNSNMSLLKNVTLSLLSLSGQTTSSSPTVSIDAGLVIGTTTSLPSATAHVNKFLGIPFAQSPPERFSPPAPVKPWSSPLNAVVNKPACVQQFNYPDASRDNTRNVYNNPPPEESEDCMYLNVWAPSGSPPGKGWPVMIWFYGGAFMFGGGGLPGYDGTHFASNENIVLVTMNYRTNAFGFLTGADEVPLEQRNLGLLDQRAALDWIQKNIEGFGGDREKVTIFGESAGAASVDALLTSYPANSKPPFRAGIMQSGQVSTGARPRTAPSTGPPANGTSPWDRLSQAFNCTDPSTISCLRAVPALNIKDVIEHQRITFGLSLDNFTLVAGSAERRRQGLIPRLPLMIGSNAQESKINMRAENNLLQYIQKTFPGNETQQNLIAQAYAVGKAFANDNDAITQISTDNGAGCATADYANLASSSGYKAFWYYYNASFPNISPIPNAGVYHASEIDIVFGHHGKTGASYANQPSTSQEIALSNFVTNAWANFARNPERGPGWPAVGSVKEDVAVLGPYGTSGAMMVKQSRVAGRCYLFK